MLNEIRGSGWELRVEDTGTVVVSEHPTADPNWRFIDGAGHAHHYDGGYPTLEQVIDVEHWCDGREGLYSHDSHMAVDKSHFECRECREVIVPGTCPPGTVARVAGPMTVWVEGYRSDGAEIVAVLMQDEWVAIQAATTERGPSVEANMATLDAVVRRVINGIPNERIQSVTFHGGRPRQAGLVPEPWKPVP